MFGHDAVRAGLKEYFAKFEFSNATLNDFLICISNGAKSVGIKRDLLQWSASWLSTSGINIVEPVIAVNDGTISSLRLRQTCHENGANILRVQKFKVALLDENMKVYFEQDIILEA